LALVLAAFEFTGLIWNTVSVSYRQRAIPDELLGRVNSIYRLLAWGMMPVGLLLSGFIVSLAESVVTREVALVTPFIVAAIGATALTIFAWRPLARGFSAALSRPATHV
ncbi:MAG: MFS transporter, partial [Pseudomonadota bacterium]